MCSSDLVIRSPPKCRNWGTCKKNFSALRADFVPPKPDLMATPLPKTLGEGRGGRERGGGRKGEGRGGEVCVIAVGG